MNLIAIPKVGFKHKVGNAICGLFKILDGLIMLLSLGHLHGALCMRFTIWRKNNNFLLDNK